MRKSTLLAAAAVLLAGDAASAAEKATREMAIEAMERAGSYFRDQLGVKGTYVWQYAADGPERRGEGGLVGESVGWIQPPGTPAVGAAFLRIYEVTGDEEWLDAARTVADALVRTQLASGGWSKSVETDPEKVARWCYRANRDSGRACDPAATDNPAANKTQLDDNTSQSVLNFLMWLDEAGSGSSREVRDSIEFGLRRLMKVQYANGAFPAVFSEKPLKAARKMTARASMPDVWPREWQKPVSGPYYLTNDDLLRDTGRMFLNAYHTYQQPEYLRTAMRIGDFLVAAQFPPPQQGWAQMYDQTLQPVWGRKFEPPSVVSRETAGSIEYLVELHGETSKAQYMETAESAAEWLKASRLADGTWARFYELKTNRPIYVDNDYRLTYEDDDLLDHYGMKVELAEPRLDVPRPSAEALAASSDYWVSIADDMGRQEVEQRADQLIESLDGEGRWVDGRWIDGQRFVDGVFILARFVAMNVEEDED